MAEKKIKVRNVSASKQPINEVTGHHPHGAVFETTPDRAKALGPLVQEVAAPAATVAK